MANLDVRAAGQRYNSGAILLHWTIAFALAFQLALGFAMPKNESGFELYQLHKSVGITILLLTLARLAWRLTHRPPPAVEGGFQGIVAKAVHTLLYVFMVGAPLAGWAIVSTDSIQIPTVFWGVVPWPHLPLPAGINEAAEVTHEALAWLGLALIVLHVAGALRHQLWLKDGLLRRMGPGGSAAAAGLLALAVVAVYFATGMKIASDVVAAGGYETAEVPAPEVTPGPLETQSATDPAAEVAEAEDEAEAEEIDAPEEAAADEPGPPPVWAIQPGGRLGFSVGSGDNTIRGSFSDWSGTIHFDPDNPETADIRIQVRLASASLGDATQDSMVQDADFFASSANPIATWRSTTVRRTGSDRFSASGTLSLKGASRPQSLTFTLSGDGLRQRVEGSASIDRTAFGVGTGEAAAGLANSVSLSFAFDAIGRTP
ncbi:MAG TPA: cytochrome b/b6 domain-containing protein [Croceibacterium sp.]|nr:cytochrome b/b6 domain-containing protein [Croceibacterium sp.]